MRPLFLQRLFDNKHHILCFLFVAIVEQHSFRFQKNMDNIMEAEFMRTRSSTAMAPNSWFQSFVFDYFNSCIQIFLL